MNLKLKFNIVFALLFVLLMLAAGAITHRVVHRHALDQVIHDAQRLMDVSVAVRDYTVKHIKPHLDPLLDRHFLPETVPAFAASQTLKGVLAQQPGYAYKEAALNPTNPANKPSDWERAVINRFRAEPGLGEQTGEVASEGGDIVYVARPIQIKNAACLACHSTPAAAPQSLTAKYGADNGFGWQLQEIVGSQVVAVPTTVAAQKASSLFWTVMGTLAAALAIICLGLNWFLQRWVLGPLQDLAVQASALSQGDLTQDEFPEDRPDEIGVVQRSVNRLRRSLTKAMELLRQ